MQWELTAVSRPVEFGFVARTEESPDVTVTGATLDETRENLRTAVRETIQSRRTQGEQEIPGLSVITETMVVTREPDGAGLRFADLGT